MLLKDLQEKESGEGAEKGGQRRRGWVWKAARRRAERTSDESDNGTHERAAHQGTECSGGKPQDQRQIDRPFGRTIEKVPEEKGASYRFDGRLGGGEKRRGKKRASERIANKGPREGRLFRALFSLLCRGGQNGGPQGRGNDSI